MLVKAEIFLVLALFITPPSLLSVSGAQETKQKLVTVEYDSAKDFTQITLNPFILVSRKQEELRLGAVAAYAGKVKTRPAEVNLIFLSLSTSDMTKYDVARKLSVTVDGQHLVLGEAEHAKQTQNGLFVETLKLAIPLDVFLRICRSKEVKLKVGVTEVPLLEQHMEILRIAASYMTE